MPGVADAIRRTELRQSKDERKRDMEEIVRMVKEGRLHEADERQMEALNLAIQLNQTFGQNQPVPVDTASIQDAVGAAVRQALQGLPNVSGSSTPEISGRPSMKHVSLSDLGQEVPSVEVSNSEKMGGQSSTGEDNSVSKLELLKKIKGNG